MMYPLVPIITQSLSVAFVMADNTLHGLLVAAVYLQAIQGIINFIIFIFNPALDRFWATVALIVLPPFLRKHLPSSDSSPANNDGGTGSGFRDAISSDRRQHSFEFKPGLEPGVAATHIAPDELGISSDSFGILGGSIDGRRRHSHHRPHNSKSRISSNSSYSTDGGKGRSSTHRSRDSEYSCYAPSTHNSVLLHHHNMATTASDSSFSSSSFSNCPSGIQFDRNSSNSRSISLPSSFINQDDFYNSYRPGTSSTSPTHSNNQLSPIKPHIIL